MNGIDWSDSPIESATSSAPTPRPTEAAEAEAQAAGEPSLPAREVLLPLYLQELEARIGKTGEILAKVHALKQFLVIQAAQWNASACGR